MAELLLATEQGQVVKFNTEDESHECLFYSSDDEALMGIELYEGHLYVASLSRLYKLNSNYEIVKQTELYSPSPDFHQMQFYDGLLYTTITKRNQIWVYDTDLNIVAVHNIEPPKPKKKVKYKKNYNHINNIVKHEGKFYVNLNWMTSTQYAESGVLVTDENFSPLDKFEFAWESHDFQFIDGKKVAICSSSDKRKKLAHPYRSGLMVEGELVWEHSADESFCKGLCYDDEYIYMCGGLKSTRKKRKDSRAVIYIISRKDYSLVKKILHNEVKAVKGAIVL